MLYFALMNLRLIRIRSFIAILAFALVATVSPQALLAAGFTVGDPVQTTFPIGVRATPGRKILGNQPYGARGTMVSGPRPLPMGLRGGTWILKLIRTGG